MKKHRIAFLVFLAVALFVHADITFQADVDGWKALDLSDLAVAPGSALDLSAWNDAPAGKHGRVVAMADGQLAFANAPNTPVRFFGFNWINLSKFIMKCAVIHCLIFRHIDFFVLLKIVII